MKTRMLTLGAVAVACALVITAWQVVAGRGARTERDAASGVVSADGVVPSEADVSGGARALGERDRPATGLTTFPIMRAVTPADVREVVRLTRDATADDLPALRDAALTSDDPLVVGNALEALGRLRAFSADDGLVALLDDARLRVRQDAVKACGLDGRAVTIPALREVLAGGDETLRPLALEALGRIGGSDAHELLAGVLEDETASATDRAFARAALDRIAVKPLTMDRRRATKSF